MDPGLPAYGPHPRPLVGCFLCGDEMEKWTEQEMARILVAWLRDAKWKVYQEVNTGYASPTCDIVAVQNNIVWAIECKRSLGFRVLDQAWWWLSYAHYSSAAVPAGRRSGKGYFLNNAMRHIGLGLLQIDKSGSVMEDFEPRLNRKPLKSGLIDWLNDAQLSYCEAGAAHGYWTPFKETCEDILRVVKQHPEGISVKELMGKINHHYYSSATARSCIPRHIDNGIVPGVRSEKINNRWIIYPDMKAVS